MGPEDHGWFIGVGVLWAWKIMAAYKERMFLEDNGWFKWVGVSRSSTRTCSREMDTPTRSENSEIRTCST